MKTSWLSTAYDGVLWNLIGFNGCRTQCIEWQREVTVWIWLLILLRCVFKTRDQWYCPRQHFNSPWSSWNEWNVTSSSLRHTFFTGSCPRLPYQNICSRSTLLSPKCHHMLFVQHASELTILQRKQKSTYKHMNKCKSPYSSENRLHNT